MNATWLIWYRTEEVGSSDFEFVKCANRRVKGVDGDAVFDGNGIKELYKSGAVYVQSIFRVRINNSL